MSVENNRSLADKGMDALDHALGRPTNPHSATTRNFFGVAVGCNEAKAMKENPNFIHTRDFMGTSGFAVSDEGKVALSVYLKANWTPPRRYNVAWGESLRTIQADTRAKAKYRAWLEMDFVDLTFGEYAKNASARLA